MLIDCEIVKQNHGIDETFMICSGLPYIRRIGIDMIVVLVDPYGEGSN